MTPRRTASGARSRKGFTLAELAMSIAILAAAGVFLVQLFLSADRLATKASDLDRAVSACTSAVETWKAASDPLDPDGLPMLDGARIVPGANGYFAIGYLDALLSPVDKASAAYRLEVDTGVRPLGEAPGVNDAYAIRVSFWRMGGSTALYELTSVRYDGPGAAR